MKITSRTIIKTYVGLILLSTFATSLVWGINTLFLLDAGLSNTQAFTANAFFTLGLVFFEVPTGIVADTWGRRRSYLLGSTTLTVSTILYLLLWAFNGGFILWCLSSLLLGLGFTFFSGANEAWLVDALKGAKYKKPLDDVFAKGQIATGISMLTGSVLGGLIAQYTNLGIPFIIRSIFLLLTLIVASIYMHDIGFKPRRPNGVFREMKIILSKSIEHGLKKKPTRWIVLSAPFTWGVAGFAFYAMQPYLLELYGDETAYLVAGLAASVIAGAQIIGGLSVSYIRRAFKHRTSILIASLFVSASVLFLIGFTSNFWVAVFLLIAWALSFAASMPVRQTLLNSLIPSEQRATVISLDSLIGNSGGIVSQPLLGRAADVWSFSASYMIASTIQIIGLPFLFLAKSNKSKSDLIVEEN